MTGIDNDLSSFRTKTRKILSHDFEDDSEFLEEDKIPRQLLSCIYLFIMNLNIWHFRKISLKVMLLETIRDEDF